MTRVLANAAVSANRGGPVLAHGISVSAHLHRALSKYLRVIFPRKTWAYLSELTGIEESAAKHRLAGTRRYTAEEIAALLRSEQGIQFLVVLMGEARPAWWKAVLRMGLLGSMQRRREADLRLLRGLSDAEQSAAATLPASVVFQDPEFFGPVLEALEAVTRAPSGAMGKGRPA